MGSGDPDVAIPAHSCRDSSSGGRPSQTRRSLPATAARLVVEHGLAMDTAPFRTSCAHASPLGGGSGAAAQDTGSRNGCHRQCQEDEAAKRFDGGSELLLLRRDSSSAASCMGKSEPATMSVSEASLMPLL